MKILNLLFILLLSPNVNAQECSQHSVRCQCFMSIPFEGFQVYIVETCNGVEQWWKEFNTPQFDSAEECEAVVKIDPSCKKLLKK
ncbi:MAG: hypothetical protein IPM57_12480 [Oligoflexia bacterium]|nr:hypothetical protein [Oligoflexia bacterium]